MLTHTLPHALQVNGMDFEPDSFKGKRLEAALKGHDSAMLKIKRAPDMMARLGQKSRLTAVVKKDVQSEAEKDISEQHDGSILKLTNTALRSSLAKRTPRGTSIEEVSDMSTVKLAAYAGMGYAMESVRSSLAKAIPETLEAGVYSRADSLEHAVRTVPHLASHLTWRRAHSQPQASPPSPPT